MTAQRVIENAARELGAKSGRKYVERYNTLTGAGISLSSAWCACFVTWVMSEADVPQSSVKPFCSCSVSVRWFKGQNRWKDPSYSPSVGDIIFFDYDSVPDGDHVGIVESCNGDKISTIEGNAGASYSCIRRTYSKSDKSILGFAIPIYASEKAPFDYDDFCKFMERYERESISKPVSSWAKESWQELVEKGVFDGTKPRAPFTREQAAAVICRLESMYKK